MFVVLLPVRSPKAGKSRLSPLGQDVRRRLAAAFALDTAVACRAASEVAAVLAVTDDEALGAQLAALGCAVTDDPGGGLNAALRHGSTVAAQRWPGLAQAALCGDLPALRSRDLDEALRGGAGRTAYVADADRTGTTLYLAPSQHFAPAFGAGSAARHAAGGAVALPGELASLRRDVDHPDDLVVAAQLGVGPRTAALVAELGLLSR